MPVSGGRGVGNFPRCLAPWNQTRTKRAEGRERAAGTAASRVAPRVGFEPTTLRLTAGRSTIELPRNGQASLFYPLPLSADKRMATFRARLEDRTYNPRGGISSRLQ